MTARKKSIPIYRKPWFPIVSAVVIIPTATTLWAYINSVLAAPQEIKSVREAIIQNAQTQEYLKDMASRNEKKDAEQDAEIDKQKEISQLQIDSLKAIVAQMSKSK